MLAMLSGWDCTWTTSLMWVPVWHMRGGDVLYVFADREYAREVAYVAVSRGAYDAQIFTNDREKLGAALGHDVSHSSAHAPEMKQEQAVTPQREIAS